MLKIISFLLALTVLPVQAEEYQSQHDFLVEKFSGPPPKPKVLWLKKKLKQSVANILQHKPHFMRTRYWQAEGKTVWILDETGKIKPITVAVTIKNQQIASLKVLSFRESRGWEVKYAFFTDQFKQKTLQTDLTLSQPVDGISGATLSVRALTKIAQLALLFNRQIQHEEK
ncbi:MAG: FMN-binding protein [Methylococcales bacterium]|nr:FMN-binding protein [Methylococcales bacterium]